MFTYYKNKCFYSSFEKNVITFQFKYFHMHTRYIKNNNKKIIFSFVTMAYILRFQMYNNDYSTKLRNLVKMIKWK